MTDPNTGDAHSSNGDPETAPAGQRRRRRQRGIQRDLDYWDVASFNINKIVGTGIFTTPGTILLLTGSNGATLGLWVVGWAHTMLRYYGPCFSLLRKGYS